MSATRIDPPAFHYGDGISRCSMGAFMNGPWVCGSYGCDKGEGCRARARNQWERDWLARNSESWEQRWAEAYGALSLTKADARRASFKARTAP